MNLGGNSLISLLHQFVKGRPWLLVWSQMLFLVAPVLGSGSGQGFQAGFDAANKLYEQGRFTDAAAGYQQLAQAGTVSAALYFNLGNAWFKSGETGRALLAYRQSSQLAPRDPDLRANLQFVRNRVSRPTLQPGPVERALNHLTMDEWTGATCAVFWIWLVMLILVQWRPSLKAALRGYLYSAGAIAGGLALLLGAAFYSSHSVLPAVVVMTKALAHNGPLEESPVAFKLHNGAELGVLDERDQWVQVTAGTQSVGWVRRDQLLMIPPG